MNHIKTSSGHVLDLHNPDPDQIADECFAPALAHLPYRSILTARDWPPYTYAQISVMTSAHMARRSYRRELCLWALLRHAHLPYLLDALHQGEEQGLLQVDRWKKAVCEAYLLDPDMLPEMEAAAQEAECYITGTYLRSGLRKDIGRQWDWDEGYKTYQQMRAILMDGAAFVNHFKLEPKHAQSR